jgi:hypothetical protein
MPIVPVTQPSWLFSPPLDVPFGFRFENGRFDSLRPRPLPAAPPCASANVIPADDPRNPTGRDVHVAFGIHQACDLASVVGNCVYAAYSGRVVEVNTDAAATKGSVMIDHHPRGLGFLTQYIHITGIRVAPGDFVHEGEPFAQISAEPEEAHLHFELWAVLDRAETGAPGDSDMVPIDPTRALYAWERRLVPDEPLPGTPVPLAVGVARIHTVPFFLARFEGDVALHVPLYEPVSEEERLTVRLLRDAHRRGLGVAASFRRSAFWGLDVVTQAELA